MSFRRSIRIYVAIYFNARILITSKTSNMVHTFHSLYFINDLGIDRLPHGPLLALYYTICLELSLT